MARPPAPSWLTGRPLPERLSVVLAALHAQARPDQLAGMARFGLVPQRRLGLSVPALRALARRIGRDQALAEALWASQIPDAQILAAFIVEPARLTPAVMDGWVRDVRSWDVGDQACNNAFVRRPDLAWERLRPWAADEAEFVRRAAFALMASLAVHDKAADDARFLALLPLVETVASDERHYVKKAVNWALRQIGKRNEGLRLAAVACAEGLQQRHASASARWIAADALRELRRHAPAG